ncbi:unnamed protein product, partial [Brassica rapa subsp. trilocularis]
LGFIVLLGFTACSLSHRKATPLAQLTFRLLRRKHSKTDQSIIFNPPPINLSPTIWIQCDIVDMQGVRVDYKK